MLIKLIDNYEFYFDNDLYTVEPVLMATLVIRSPRYYSHFFWPPDKNDHTFSCKGTLVNLVITAKFFWPIGDRINRVPLY